MRPWRTRSRRTLLERSPWLTVESHAVELPDGEVIEDWPWIVGREFVNVFAETKEGSFLVFRQVKYAVEGTSLAPVGGYLDDGEEPLAAARRELLEETGHAAADWTPLGRYVVDGNRGAGVGHLYLARGARKVAVPSITTMVLNRNGDRSWSASAQFTSVPSWDWASESARMRFTCGRNSRHSATIFRRRRLRHSTEMSTRSLLKKGSGSLLSVFTMRTPSAP